MSALALQSSEHLALPLDPVARGTADTHNSVSALLGDILLNGEMLLKEGMGLTANAVGRVIRFTGDMTVATVKNLFGGFLRRPHS
jgi:hypothetical protein